LREIKLAIPTKGNKGIDDAVSDVFGRAITFTIIDIEEKEIKKVEVIKNPAESLKHGAGPIVVTTLIDLGVKAIIAHEFGPGASTILDHFNITKVEVKTGISVAQAVNEFLEQVDNMVVSQ
jgi:predicted Fe-Mo cluster-binding NifX family protein